MTNPSPKLERTIKVVLVATGSKRGYSYSAWRVVECRIDQRGYRSERGVRVIWESQDLYRPTTKSGRGQGPEAERRAREIAKAELTNLMTHEMGKVKAEAGGDVQEAIDMTYYMAGEGRRLWGQTTPSELRDKFNMSMRMPIGVRPPK